MIALYRWTATTVGHILDRQEYLGIYSAGQVHL